MDNASINIDRPASHVLPNNPSVINCESLCIHSISDIFEPTNNYVGLIDYSTGNIYIKQSDWIVKNTPQRRRRRRGGRYLHGRLFYFIYGYWKTQTASFIGRGFSYLNGEWKFLSRTLNPISTDHQVNKFEEKLLQIVIDNLYINHRWIGLYPNHHIDCRTLVTVEQNRKYMSRVHPSMVHISRKLHGTFEWLDYQRSRLGFIQCIGLDRDFHIHATAVRSSPSNNERNVEFNIMEDGNGWKAVNISFV